MWCSPRERRLLFLHSNLSPVMEGILRRLVLVSPPNHAFPSVSRTLLISIAVGRETSGPSIEGPFYRAVRLCRALETENKEKGRKNRKKKRKKWENCRNFVHFLCNSVFLVSIYTIQITLFVMQPGSFLHWRTTKGLTPATALRPWLSVFLPTDVRLYFPLSTFTARCPRLLLDRRKNGQKGKHFLGWIRHQQRSVTKAVAIRRVSAIPIRMTLEIGHRTSDIGH